MASMPPTFTTRIDKSMRMIKKYAIVNIVAALLMFLIFVSLCAFGCMKMADNWEDASEIQEKMSRFAPTTPAEQGMKTLLLHFCWATKLQKAEFFLLLAVVFTFGYFGVYSFIIARKLVVELAKHSNETSPS